MFIVCDMFVVADMSAAVKWVPKLKVRCVFTGGMRARLETENHATERQREGAPVSRRTCTCIMSPISQMAVLSPRNDPPSRLHSVLIFATTVGRSRPNFANRPDRGGDARARRRADARRRRRGDGRAAVYVDSISANSSTSPRSLARPSAFSLPGTPACHGTCRADTCSPAARMRASCAHRSRTAARNAPPPGAAGFRRQSPLMYRTTPT